MFFEKKETISKPPAYKDKSQQFVLFNTTTNTCGETCIRFNGAFSSQKDAISKMEYIKQFTDSNFLLAECGEFTPVYKDVTNITQETIDRDKMIVINNNKKKGQESEDEFYVRKEEASKRGPVECEKELQQDATFENEDDNDNDDTESELINTNEEDDALIVNKSKDNLNDTCSNAKQRLVVCAFVDTCEEAECDFVFNCVKFFDTDEDADTFIRNVASKQIIDSDIHICDTNQWISPKVKITQRIYRDDRLNEFMKREKMTKNELENQ